MRQVPVDSRTSDWPRKIADTVNALVRRDSRFASLGDYADDTAAAAGGVVIGELYRTGSTVKVRIT